MVALNNSRLNLIQHRLSDWSHLINLLKRQSSPQLTLCLAAQRGWRSWRSGRGMRTSMCGSLTRRRRWPGWTRGWPGWPRCCRGKPLIWHRCKANFNTLVSDGCCWDLIQGAVSSNFRLAGPEQTYGEKNWTVKSHEKFYSEKQFYFNSVLRWLSTVCLWCG